MSSRPFDRYGRDVLDPKAAANRRRTIPDVVAQLGMVLEDPASGFVGEIVAWENGLLVLEDRHNKRRSFPTGPGFWLEGKPVSVKIPSRTGTTKRYTASGSIIGTPGRAKTALPSRIYVEGRHDAQLVEKIWGDDLRHVGVVVEYLGGIDDLVRIVEQFAPCKGRRLAVLVDHLRPGTKEKIIADQVMAGGYGEYVMITGHSYIDIWQAIKPQVVGIKAWPKVPKDQDFKKGTLAALGQPHKDQADIACAWQKMLRAVRTWKDLDGHLVREVEKMIDFVTQDHSDALE